MGKSWKYPAVKGNRYGRALTADTVCTLDEPREKMAGIVVVFSSSNPETHLTPASTVILTVQLKESWVMTGYVEHVFILVVPY